MNMFRSRAVQIVRQFSISSNVTQRTWSGDKCVNQVSLLGRMGGDPIVRGEQSNVLTFSLATNINIKSKVQTDNEDRVWKQITQWHDIVVFRPYLRDSVAKNCQKGDRVYVTGRLEYRKFEDENAKSHKQAHVVADDVILLESLEQQLDEGKNEDFIDKGFE